MTSVARSSGTFKEFHASTPPRLEIQVFISDHINITGSDLFESRDTVKFMTSFPDIVYTEAA